MYWDSTRGCGSRSFDNRTYGKSPPFPTSPFQDQEWVLPMRVFFNLLFYHNRQVTISGRPPELPQRYTYTVKVIKCKNTFTAWCHRHIHICLIYTKKKLIKSFSDHALEISETDRLSIDFIESHKSAGKRWVVSSKDLEMMYRKFDPGSDMVWWESDCKKRTSNKAQEAEIPYQSERKRKLIFH